jgi:hypothetical protein
LQVTFEYQDGRRVVATRDYQGNESPSFVFKAPSYWEEKLVWMFRRNSFEGPNMCDSVTITRGEITERPIVKDYLPTNAQNKETTNHSEL